jgi:ribonuclease PH
MRLDERANTEIRPLSFELSPIKYAEGSTIVRMGETHVLCAVTLERGVPRWRQGQGKGWLTAEYALMPRSTETRTPRSHIESGRAQEIRRLIGRSLRRAVDFERLGESTLIVDCDVMQADGGTRTAAINGGYVAVALALKPLIASGHLPSEVLRQPIGAISVGIVEEEPRLDLAYAEDVNAEMDLNVVIDAAGRFVEVQGTAEGTPVSRAQLDGLLDLAAEGIQTVIRSQREALACAGIEA